MVSPDVTYVASITGGDDDDDDDGELVMYDRVVCWSVSCVIVSITQNAVASRHPEVSCSRLWYLYVLASVLFSSLAKCVGRVVVLRTC